MTGIIIVTYNAPDLLPLQLELIAKYCSDEHEVVVIDNSTDLEAKEAVSYHARNCRVYKTESASMNGSGSHAFAANFAIAKLGCDYGHYLLLDHDIFPTKPFSVPEMLEGKPLGGLGQIKHKEYLWPGFTFWERDKVGKMDFSTQPGLDTGGGTWVEVESAGIENVAWQPEVYHENPHFKKLPYNFYSMIGDGWMHFINASGWNDQDGQEERLNSLKNILIERTS